MRSLHWKIAILIAIFTGFESPAFASISFGEWSWQILNKRENSAPAPIDEILLPPNGYLKGRLKAVLNLNNQGASREGILLRYTLSAKVYSSSNPKREEGWTIPFAVDERRVPILKSGQNLPVVFDVTDPVKDYFKRLSLEGWKPEKIKMEVMIEPRQGENSALKTTQTVLNVAEDVSLLEKK